MTATIINFSEIKQRCADRASNDPVVVLAPLTSETALLDDLSGYGLLSGGRFGYRCLPWPRLISS
jgi:hypothetical protein